MKNTSLLKTPFVLVALLLSQFIYGQMPAAITIDPPDATAYDELTLTFDPAEACSESSSLAGLPSIAIHSGVSILNVGNWFNVITFDGTGANGQATTLLPTGDGKFEITYTPADFYGLTDEVVTHICAVFNNGTDWTQDGRDFNPSNDCQDFLIPLTYNAGDSEFHFQLNMNKLIMLEMFDPEIDDVFAEFDDVLIGEKQLTDLDADGIYEVIFDENISQGVNYTFHFRINSDQYENFPRTITGAPGILEIYAWWNNDPISKITFIVDMTYQIDMGAFEPEVDYVDIAGTMNNWSFSPPMEDMGDNRYEIQYGFEGAGIVEYKFRINGDWATGEFPNGGPNRMTWSILDEVVVEHFFNDYNTDAWPGIVDVDMNQEIAQGNFDPDADYVDISASFNNFGNHQLLFDRPWTADGVYTTYVLVDKNEPDIEFKFRINADPETSEFPGNGPYRNWTLTDTAGGAFNFYTCVYNLMADPYPPYAYDLYVEGLLFVGENVTGHYTYNDPNGDPEGASEYQWYRSDNPSGLNPTIIAGANDLTYEIVEEDLGNYLVFEVTPVSAMGSSSNGDPVSIVTNMISTTSTVQLNMPEIKLMPNPASNRIFLQGKVLIENVGIHDSKGQLVLEEWNINEINPVIDISNLPGGVYLVRIEDLSKNVKYIKFVKQ